MGFIYTPDAANMISITLESDPWVSVALIAIASLALAVSGIKKQPGLGTIIIFPLIMLKLWRGDWELASLGFFPPESWGQVLLISLLAGILIALGEVTLFEPAAEALSGEPVNKSILNRLRGDWRSTVIWLALTWTVVAFAEEIIFRGFLLGETIKLLGNTWLGAILAAIYVSVIFGLAHWYQGKPGALSTGLVSMILCWMFVAYDQNLWLPILTHGFIDTFGLLMIYANLDQRLRRR